MLSNSWAIVVTFVLDAGMMLPNEQEIIEKLHIHYNKYYVPFVWASTLVVKSRRQGLIRDDFAVQTILDVRPPVICVKR